MLPKGALEESLEGVEGGVEGMGGGAEWFLPAPPDPPFALALARMHIVTSCGEEGED